MTSSDLVMSGIFCMHVRVVNHSMHDCNQKLAALDLTKIVVGSMEVPSRL